MATRTSVPRNPFLDPVLTGLPDQDRFSADATLVVNKDTSMTLGADVLVVFDDEGFDRKPILCGLLPSHYQPIRTIPLYNILWAEIEGQQIRINYAHPTSKLSVRADVLSYKFESSLQEAAENWVAKLLERSYGQAQKQKRAKILVNPFSGKGGAVNIYDREIAPILAAARCHIDVVHTKSGAEASEIAEKIDIEAFDTIVSCSGDGLPHLVFNGLGKRPDAKRALEKIAVVQLPCGSGNAMSWNLNGTNSPSLATLAVIKGISIPLDLMSITQGNTRTLSFLSQSVGIVAESDLATEHLRWMGEARFTYGFLVRLLGKTVYPCDIAIKVESEDKASIKALYEEEKTSQLPASERRGNKPLLDDDESGLSGNELGLPPLRFGTVNDKLPEGMQLVPYDTIGNFYCGNMAYVAANTNFFPASLPSDGMMDLVTIDGTLPIMKAIELLTSVEKNNIFAKPDVRYRKIVAYRLVPRAQDDGYISIDGERIPFAPFQVEIHRGLGTVYSKNGHVYEAEGPKL